MDFKFKIFCLSISVLLNHHKRKLQIVCHLPSWHEMSLRDLNQISIERDISGTSRKYLRTDDFFVTSLRRLKNIWKKLSFVDVFKTSQIYSKNDVYSVTSLRRLKNISCKYVWFLKNTPQKWFLAVSVELLKYLIK